MGRAKRKNVTCSDCGKKQQIFNHAERPLVWECADCGAKNTIEK